MKGDPIADLTEDLAAEQKARATYEYLIDLADDPDVIDVLRFLREREVVHFQRFGEALRTVQEKLAERKFYMNANMGINTNNSNMACCSNVDAKTSCTIANNIKTENSCGCGNNLASNNINNNNSDGNCSCGK